MLRPCALALLLLAASPVARAGQWRVVGGDPAEEGDWTDAVALFSGSSYLCTGVLIAPDLVLTAAHCDWSLSRAIVGAHDHTEDGEEIRVVETWAHPRSWSTYDVAVVKLEHDATAEPRVLALDCIVEDWLEDGADVAIVGYGATDQWAQDDTTVLHEATSVVVDHDCSELVQGCNSEVSPGGELIAGGDGVDSCNGDSGGPLYLLTSEGDFLVGITSRATNTGTVPCGDGGIYVRVDAVADWIEEVGGETLPRPDCSDRPNRAPAISAPRVVVGQGETAAVPVTVEDPDPDDTHTLTVASPPARGTVEIEADGTVWYTAGWDGFGDDAFVLQVTDDGVPSLSASARVDVAVLPVVIQRGGCGCEHSGPPSALSLLLGLAWIRRRREE